MNNKIVQLLLLILVVVSIAISCSKKGNTLVANDPCAGKTISLTATVTDASAGTSNGSLSVAATGSAGFTYNINGGAFVSTTVFSNLAAGSYTVIAKDADGCTKQASFTVNVADVCAGKNFVFTPSFVAADKCAGDGQLTITVTGGTGLQYKLDGSVYQAATVFSNVSSGTHNVFAKDAAGCEKSASVTMPEKPAGSFFTDVKAMLLVKCANCHTNGGVNGGVNFDTDCGIVAKRDRIKVRAVDQGTMPQGGPQLTATEKAKITNWITAGGQHSN